MRRISRTGRFKRDYKHVKAGVYGSTLTFDELLKTDIVGYILSSSQRTRRARADTRPVWTPEGPEEPIPPSPHPVQ